MATRDEVETAWKILVETNGDGDFKYQKKGDEHKITCTCYMDATLATKIMLWLSDQEEPQALIPDMGTKQKPGF